VVDNKKHVGLGKYVGEIFAEGRVSAKSRVARKRQHRVAEKENVDALVIFATAVTVL
jgi:hypothetical protein